MSPVSRFEADQARLLLQSRAARYRYILDTMWKCGLLGAVMGLVISVLVIAHSSGLMHLFSFASLKNICVSSIATCLFFSVTGLCSAHEELENLLKQKQWAEDYNSFQP